MDGLIQVGFPLILMVILTYGVLEELAKINDKVERLLHRTHEVHVKGSTDGY